MGLRAGQQLAAGIYVGLYGCAGCGESMGDQGRSKIMRCTMACRLLRNVGIPRTVACAAAHVES